MQGINGAVAASKTSSSLRSSTSIRILIALINTISTIWASTVRRLPKDTCRISKVLQLWVAMASNHSRNRPLTNTTRRCLVVQITPRPAIWSSNSTYLAVSIRAVTVRWHRWPLDKFLTSETCSKTRHLSISKTYEASSTLHWRKIKCLSLNRCKSCKIWSFVVDLSRKKKSLRLMFRIK